MYSRILSICLMLLTTGSYARQPMLTFTPFATTTVSTNTNVSYQVTNQSNSDQLLAMNDIPGVTQITTGNEFCGSPFLLPPKGSCILNLQVGAQAAGNTNGPVVCGAGSQLQCYRPNPADRLVISNSTGYTVGGNISGLNQGKTVNLSLSTNSGTVAQQSFTATSASSGIMYTFSTALPNGTLYTVTFDLPQPAPQTCVFDTSVTGCISTKCTGTINGADVTNVNVICS